MGCSGGISGVMGHMGSYRVMGSFQVMGHVRFGSAPHLWATRTSNLS